MPDEKSEKGVEHPKDNSPPGIPVPKTSIIPEGMEMSSTQIFMVEKIEEAKETALEAKRNATAVEEKINGLETHLKTQSENTKSQFDSLKHEINAGNKRTDDTFSVLTTEVKSLNENLNKTNVALAELRNVKAEQDRIRVDVAGQRERLNSHINDQSQKNIIHEDKITSLKRESAKDYQSVNLAISNLRDTMETSATNLSKEIKKTQDSAKPTIEMGNRIKWVVRVVVGLSLFALTVIQIYKFVSESNKDEDKKPSIEHKSIPAKPKK